MEMFLNTVLEIAKFTIPALVIYFTIQKVTKNQLNSIVGLKNLEFRQQQTDKVLPLKLQAYERLTLLLSRIRLTNILGRIDTNGMSIDEIKTLIILSIKQEVDHNVSQKIYVSKKLWQVIEMAIEKTLQLMEEVSQMPPKNGQEFLRLLYEVDGSDGLQIHNIAQQAIKEEVNVLLR